MARVLVAEPDPKTRARFARLAVAAGHEVVTAGDGDELDRRLAAGGLDVVVADHGLLAGGPEALAASLETHTPGAQLVLTASADAAGGLGAVDSAFDLVVKPVEGDELLRSVAHAARVAALGRELAELRARIEPPAGAEATSALDRRLLEAQKLEAVGRLAGGVAHDFNNLLAVILSYANFVKDELGDNDQARTDVEEIIQAAERAESLTRQLLAFSRREIVDKRELSLADAVRGIEKLLRRVLGEDVELTVRTPEAMRPVLADPGQVGQLVLNLAVNAREAMSEGGRLVVEVTELDEDATPPLPEMPPGQWAVLSLRDSGRGMDEATLAQVFQPFFTTKEVGEGSGLGLAAAYAVVQDHGGHITVDSAPGEGTTVSIYLPSASPRTEPSGALAALGEEGFLGTGGETILVAEDETAVREIARRILEEEGWEVLTAANAGEALLICERHEGPIHLLVTDVVMPHMSGPELVERALLLRPRMKVLYMTGYADSATVARIRRNHEADILFKPFTRLAFAEKVAERLNRTPTNGHTAI